VPRIQSEKEARVVPEARLATTGDGLAPESEGWFVVNARDARWWRNEKFGSAVAFESDEALFRELGINIHVLMPGEPNCMYHGENAQEDFLVLYGECLLLVEGEERPLRQWDFFHSPAWTEHVFVGAGDGPCGILMVGVRPAEKELLYPVVDVARKHGAGVDQETRSGREAYARFPKSTTQPYPEGALPTFAR
jgi:uncharacterized cupin superfamily protein